MSVLLWMMAVVGAAGLFVWALAAAAACDNRRMQRQHEEMRARLGALRGWAAERDDR